MEILLNEFSVDGQFDSLERFRDYVLFQFHPVMQCIIEKKIPFFKKQDVYSYKITKEETLHDILKKNTNDPVVSVLRSDIINLGYVKPYWDDEIKTNKAFEYTYVCKDKEPNCFTEAIEREGALFSFPHEDFSENVFDCKKNGNPVILYNITERASFLRTLIEKDIEMIDYVLENYPFERKIQLAKIDGRCYAREALLECDLDKKDMLHMIEKLPMMISGLKNGEENHYWKKLRKDIFEFRINVSKERTFRLFFVQQTDSIIFLNGFIKKSQDTPKTEMTKAIRLKNMLR